MDFKTQIKFKDLMYDLQDRVAALEEWRDKHCAGMSAEFVPKKPTAQPCPKCGAKANMGQGISAVDYCFCSDINCVMSETRYMLSDWNRLRFAEEGKA